MPRPENHGGTKDTDDGRALARYGSFGLAFDAQVARHACRAGTRRPGIDVGTYRRHERQMLHLARCLQSSRKRSIELHVDGAMLIQGKLGRAGTHSQDTEPDYFAGKLAQHVDNGLTKFVRLHFRDEMLLHLRTQSQIERPPRHDENPAETAAANDFGQEGLANGARCSQNDCRFTGHPREPRPSSKFYVIQDPIFYLLAAPAVILLGFSKGGLAGVGSLALPLMALVIDPVQAAAILLPILIAQDIVGVWSFRKHLDWYVLGWTLPGAIVGILIGYLFAARVSAAGVMALVGSISIAFGACRLWTGRKGTPKTAGTPSPGWVGSLAGVASGFTSQIAHAGAPPFQLWVMPRRLPRDMLVGTWAVYFAALNWIKVPAFAALGQFSRTNVLTAAALLPVAIVSTFAGVWLVRRIDGERFYTIIYWLMILVGVILIGEAVL